jgi:hypothetical protein
MEAFGFTLDSLLVECSREMKIIYFSMIVIIFIFGLFNNFCSFVIFKRPTPRKFGVGNYLFQIIAITPLIVFAARSRTKTTGGKINFHQVLIKQFQTQKELYITPIIIILSALPQTILTFSLACTELNIWQRHTLIIAYLLSYTPQILGFILYVLPSTTYKKEFSETSIAKSWIFNEKKIVMTDKKIKQ